MIEQCPHREELLRRIVDERGVGFIGYCFLPGNLFFLGAELEDLSGAALSVPRRPVFELVLLIDMAALYNWIIH